MGTGIGWGGAAAQLGCLLSVNWSMTGDRCVEQHLRLLRLPRATRVRPRQLRRQGRRQVGSRQ